MDEEETTIEEVEGKDTMENEPRTQQHQSLDDEKQPSSSLNKPRTLGIFLCLVALCYTAGVAYHRRRTSDGVPPTTTTTSSSHLETEEKVEKKEDEIGEIPFSEEEFEYFAGMVEASPPIPSETENEINNDNNSNNDNDDNDDNDDEYKSSPSLSSLAKRMTPRNILYNTTIDNHKETITTFPNKQFFHLHHMKTGGTSLDSLLRCAINRLSTQLKQTIPQYSLSECSYSHYQKCISHADQTCIDHIEKATTMSYCAPLAQANAFEWTHADAITTIRNPVDRVWSMYRFTTKRCYCCLPLTEVYERHEKGTLKDVCDAAYSGVCMAQLYNHQTRNLLSTLDMEDMDDEARMEEAIYNLEHRFAVVGLTHELPNYVKMLGEVFPWLSKHGIDIENENGPGHDDDDKKKKKRKCVLEHENSSPSNNHCGKNGKHLPLDDEPDKETRQAIENRNKMDTKLFERAVRHFRRQKKALGWELLEDENEEK